MNKSNATKTEVQCGWCGESGTTEICEDCGHTANECYADVDKQCRCVKCEAYVAEMEAYWRPLYEGEKLAGLLTTENP